MEHGKHGLNPADREAIQRLIEAGAIEAAAKLFCGSTDCGHQQALRAVEQMTANMQAGSNGQ